MVSWIIETLIYDTLLEYWQVYLGMMYFVGTKDFCVWASVADISGALYMKAQGCSTSISWFMLSSFLHYCNCAMHTGSDLMFKKKQSTAQHGISRCYTSEDNITGLTYTEAFVLSLHNDSVWTLWNLSSNHPMREKEYLQEKNASCSESTFSYSTHEGEVFLRKTRNWVLLAFKDTYVSVELTYMWQVLNQSNQKFNILQALLNEQVQALGGPFLYCCHM